MPKRITSIEWGASNLPSGLSFNTATGTFSGTPAEAGDYTVPVTVRTNYGEDTKNVSISVEEKAWSTVTNAMIVVTSSLYGGTTTAMNNGEMVAQRKSTAPSPGSWDWYFDYSLVPQGLCLKVLNDSVNAYIDVKQDGTVIPKGTWDIGIYLVNQTLRKYQRFNTSIKYSNNYTSPKSMGLGGAVGYYQMPNGDTFPANYTQYYLAPDISEISEIKNLES